MFQIKIAWIPEGYGDTVIEKNSYRTNIYEICLLFTLRILISKREEILLEN